MRYLGAHLSSSGGAGKTIELANMLGINSIQIMPTPPMRWSAKEISSDLAKKFVEAQKGSVVKKVLMHGVYLINLARSDSQMFHLSKLSVKTYLDYASDMIAYAKEMSSDLDVLGVTFHPGSAKDLSVDDGIKRISEGIDWILDNSKGESMLLLESSAGAGNVLGDTLEELALMREGVQNKARVGFVLDTQHMFVSGYDWRGDLDGIVSNIDATVGIKNIKAFHLNDSMTDCGSHRDRHHNLGEGKIGIEAITSLINHPKLKEIPFILETPNLKSLETIKKETDLLLSIGV